MSKSQQESQREGASLIGSGSDFEERGGFWKTTLFHAPWGAAILEAATGVTVWVNAALHTMLQDGAGRYSVIGQTPPHYLPGLKREAWEAALPSTTSLWGEEPPSHRLQLVHETTRNIAYWEWSLHPIEGTRCVLLSVQSVTDSVMNERMLATAGRAADRARQRAEAMTRLNRLVSESTTVPDLLRAIVEEAAAYFESEHAVVLLREGAVFRFGHSVGLADARANADFLTHPDETLAMQALREGQALALANASGSALRLPVLANGTRPGAAVSGPIGRGETPYGAVSVYFTEPRFIQPEELALLSAFADQVGLALQKADLYEQIATQKRQLQSIFDNAPVNIVLLDTAFRVVAINQSAIEHYWEHEGSPVGKDCKEVFHDVPPNLFPDVLSGTPFHASHYLYRLANGRDGVCDVSILPLRDESRSVVGLLLLSFEVTELVQAQQEAENALAAARAAQTQMVQMEKMRAIGELASGVAHDLNNALMAILGYTELAEEDLDDPAALTASLKVIRKATTDASSTVKRLQNFARQKTAPQGTPTDVNQVVQDVIEMTRPRWRDEAQKQGRHYDVQAKLAELPPLVAEASGLREALLNMIHNALDAMPDGGGLTLETRLRAADDSDAQAIEIEIADTGKGMTPEVAARIFDPFFTTRGVEGTGLGLAVSWTIIQRHGGNITVDTAPGQGTRFTLHFPLTALPSDRQGTVGPSSAAPAPASVPAASGARILVVDDEPFIASILTSILTRRGHRVSAANDAKQALQILREPDADFDLLISDHGMPGMTGLELLAEIRRNGPQVPVIMLTGWGQSLLQNHDSAETPDALLGKPINQADLLEAVGRVLREAKNRY